MRLWHEKMLPFLSKQHLMGQHRECCALRGNGWGKKHSTVDYVFTYAPSRLADYHLRVIRLLERKAVQIDPRWKRPTYRGQFCCGWRSDKLYDSSFGSEITPTALSYPEHGMAYWVECRENLKRKGFDVSGIPEQEPK